MDDPTAAERMMPLTDWVTITDHVADITYRVRFPVGIPRNAWMVVVEEEWDVPDDGIPCRTIRAADVWTDDDPTRVRFDARPS